MHSCIKLEHKCIHTSYNGGGALTTLRLDPHLESKIPPRYLHAGFESQLIPSAGEIHCFTPVGARVLHRRGAAALAGKPAVHRGNGALAPGQTGGTSPRQDRFGFPHLHHLALGACLSQDRPAVCSHTKDEQDGQTLEKSPNFHFTQDWR